MKENARRLHVKANRLMRLYSLWHETHQEDVHKKCMSLLGEILVADPSFNLRREFQMAF